MKENKTHKILFYISLSMLLAVFAAALVIAVITFPPMSRGRFAANSDKLRLIRYLQIPAFLAFAATAISNISVKKLGLGTLIAAFAAALAVPIGIFAYTHADMTVCPYPYSALVFLLVPLSFVLIAKDTIRPKAPHNAAKFVAIFALMMTFAFLGATSSVPLFSKPVVTALVYRYMIIPITICANVCALANSFCAIFPARMTVGLYLPASVFALYCIMICFNATFALNFAQIAFVASTLYIIGCIVAEVAKSAKAKAKQA